VAVWVVVVAWAGAVVVPVEVGDVDVGDAPVDGVVAVGVGATVERPEPGRGELRLAGLSPPIRVVATQCLVEVPCHSSRRRAAPS